MEVVEQAAPNDPYGLRGIVDEWRDQAPGRRPSYDDVAYEARKHGAPDGFVGSWLSKVLGGGRPYDLEMLSAIARALGREPQDLPHYRLALTRRMLDERVVGLEVALDLLYVMEARKEANTQFPFGTSLRLVDDQQENAAEAFEQDAEEASQPPSEHSASSDEDAPTAGDQETHP